MKQWELNQLDDIREEMTKSKRTIGSTPEHLITQVIELDKRLRRGKAKRQPNISYC